MGFNTYIYITIGFNGINMGFHQLNNQSMGYKYRHGFSWGLMGFHGICLIIVKKKTHWKKWYNMVQSHGIYDMI